MPHDPGALAGADKGPLSGMRFAVKDLYDTVGAVTGGGSPDWLASHQPARANAPVVQSLLDAGASMVGKTVCDELFYSLQGDNAHYGTPVNTRAPGRLPGGSSSGSAAAVAAGLCDFALGSDTGGSVRVPASFCGLFGLRPSHGRIDLGGAMAMAPSFDTGGWFADDAGLFRTVGGVLLDRHARAAGIDHLLLAEDAFAMADAPVAAALSAVLDRAGGALPTAEPVTVAADGFDGWREAFRVRQAFEVWQTFGEWVEAARPKLGPGIADRIAWAAGVSAADVEAVRPQHEAARERLHALLPAGTVLCLPSAPCIAPLLGIDAGQLDHFRARALALTCMAGLSGLPQVSLPAATVEGCPVGLSFIGWAGGDEALLDLGVALAPAFER